MNLSYKRLLALFAVFFLALVPVACSNDSDSKKNKDDDKEQSQDNDSDDDEDKDKDADEEYCDAVEGAKEVFNTTGELPTDDELDELLSQLETMRDTITSDLEDDVQVVIDYIELFTEGLALQDSDPEASQEILDELEALEGDFDEATDNVGEYTQEVCNVNLGDDE